MSTKESGSSEIAQKIFELREAIAKTHPKARLRGIKITAFAKEELVRQIIACHGNLFAGPISLKNGDIGKIFDIDLEWNDSPCFDYGAMDAELCRYFGRMPNVKELQVAKHICQWQHTTLAAKLAEWKGHFEFQCDKTDRYVREVEALEEEREELKAENKQSTDQLASARAVLKQTLPLLRAYDSQEWDRVAKNVEQELTTNPTQQGESNETSS